VLGGLTLLDAEQRRTAGGVNAGKDAIGVPETQLNLGTEVGCARRAGPVAERARRLHGQAVRRRRQPPALPSWTRIDLGANYMTRLMDRDVTLRARVDNAFDRKLLGVGGRLSGIGLPGAGGAAHLHRFRDRRLLIIVS
jgi:iron complex outermembrane receptor protein